MKRAIDRLESDRRRGATALAMDAVEILGTAPQADRVATAESIALLRPSMPAIGSMVRRLRDAGLDALAVLVEAAPNLVLVDGRPGPDQIQSIRRKRM